MKKLRKLKKGLAVLLAVAMVVGLMPGMGNMKVSAEEEGSATVTFTALDGNPVGVYDENFGTDKRYYNLLDGKSSTDWKCAFTNSSYMIFKASQSVYVDGYSVWTGWESLESYNPVDWTLYACNDYDESNKSGGNWTMIHEVTSANLGEEHSEEHSYNFTKTTDCYKYFKLNITKNNGGKYLEFGEFALSYEAATTCVHTWGEEINVEPTCTEGGYTFQTCTDCGAEQKSNLKDALGHSWETSSVVEPTCTEGGYTLQTCTRCGAEQKIEIKSALGHAFGEDEFCTRCRIAIKPSKPNGDGTTTSPYQIGTAAELYWFAGLVNGDESVCTDGVSQNTAANAVLTEDITVNQNVLKADGSLADDVSKCTIWTPIAIYIYGNDNKPYTGTFDGQGHTVSGLYFNESTSRWVGLFGGVEGNGSVSNVGVTNSYFKGKFQVGGVCGENTGGTITNCYNTGYVESYESAGGVCGKNHGKITGCHNEGTVIATSEYGSCAGGVCGTNYNGTITNCYNTGAVSRKIKVGGVCGWNYEGTIINCYNTGTVSGESYIGGVSGANDGFIANCYFDRDNYSGNAVGGDSGTVTDVEDKTTAQFNSGEVCYLLSKGCAIGEGESATVYDGSGWGQKLGENGDSYPVLKKTEDKDNTVYQYTNCMEMMSYTNDSALSGTTGSHDFSAQGVCSNCNHKYSKSDLTAYVSSLSEVAGADYSDATFAVYSNAKTEAESLAASENDVSAEDLYKAYCELKSAYEALKPAALIVGTVANPSSVPDSGSGVQTGGGRYAVGETVTLTAEGVNGWTFNGWYKDEKLVSDKAKVTFVVTEDMSGTVEYTAKYTHVSHTMDENSHTCSVCGINYYKVTFDYGNSTTEEVYTTGNVEFPAGDYIFKVGETVIDTSDYTVSEDTTITVESLDKDTKYAVTITGDAHCTLTVTDSNGNTVVNGDEVAAGTILKVSVKVDDGYTLTTTPESSYTVSETTTITAVTEAKTYAVTVDDTYYKSGEAGAPTASVEDLLAVPYGTSLTLTAADANSGYEFLGWYQTNGKQLTAEKVYTVTITSALTVQPRYQKNSGTVTFVANGIVVGTFTGTSITEENFPKTPVAPSGYEFDSWDKNVTEINTLLADNNVTVTATFKKIANSFTVSVYNGNATEPENTAYEETTRVIVTAQDVTGMNFAYWTLNGEIQSYNKTVSFYTSSDCVLKAVYSDVVTTAKGTATLQTGNYDLSTKRLSMVCYLTVPDDCTMVKAGVIAASGNSSKYNAQDELTMDNADYVKTGSNLSGLKSLTYTWIKSNVSVGDTWYARAYVTYTDSENNTVTVYGDRIILNAGTDYDYTEKASAKINSVSWDASMKRATFASYITVPDGAVMEKAGVVAANSSAYNPETAILTTENATYVKSGTNLSSLQTLTYTWIKSNVSSGDIWYARAYVIYTDESGVSHTVYGNIIKYQAE